MKRSFLATRTPFVLAIVLAIPAIAYAQKMRISAGKYTFDVPCDAITQKDGPTLSCADLCKKIDDKPFISCTLVNGIMHIQDDSDTVTLDYASGYADIVLGPDSPTSVTSDEPPASITGFADHPIAVQVVDESGNILGDLGMVSEFVVNLDGGQRLLLTSPGQPANVSLSLLAPTVAPTAPPEASLPSNE